MAINFGQVLFKMSVQIVKEGEQSFRTVYGTPSGSTNSLLQDSLLLAKPKWPVAQIGTVGARKISSPMQDFFAPVFDFPGDFFEIVISALWRKAVALLRAGFKGLSKKKDCQSALHFFF